MAARPPLQFVAPTDGVSCSGSPVGSTTTNGMPRVLSCAASISLRSENTAMTPVGRRLSTPSIQPRPGVRRPCISVMTTARWFSRATCSTPITISSAHSLSSSWKISSMSCARRADRSGSLVATLADDRLDPTPGLGRDVGPSVDHLGDGRHGHPGLLRHLGDRRSARSARLDRRDRLHRNECTETFEVECRASRCRSGLDAMPARSHTVRFRKWPTLVRNFRSARTPCGPLAACRSAGRDLARTQARPRSLRRSRPCAPILRSVLASDDLVPQGTSSPGRGEIVRRCGRLSTRLSLAPLS